MLDKASKLSNSKPFHSALSKFGSIVMRTRDAENARIQKVCADVQAKAKEIFGVKKNSELNHILNRQSNEKVDIGAFTIEGGKIVSLEMTRAEMIKKYQEFQDPTLNDTFEKGMHWTGEIVKAIKNKLTTQEKAWADYQMEFYQKYYNDVNKVYRNIYGIDLAHNEHYSPVSREFDAEVPEQQLVYREMARWATVTNGSLKARERNLQPLKQVDANRTFINHIIQMEHFINWANTMKELRTVFMDKGVRTALIQYHGKDMLNQIDSYIQDFARGGVDKALNVHGLDKLRGNFAKAVLGLKPAIALQQIPTVFAYLTEMKTGNFFSGVADFWTHPIENYKWMLNNVPYIKDRYTSGFERDMKVALNSDSYKNFLNSDSITKKAYFLMTIGDKFGVLQGWWAKYQEGIKSGLGKEQAIAEANDATDRTQNTSSIDTLSSWQRGGTFWKLLTMFQSQPNKYFRIIGNNVRNFQYARGSRVKAASNVLLAWVILPAIFTLIQSGFKFRKDRELSDVVMAPINDVLFFGSAAQWLTDRMIGENFEYQSTPVEAPLRDLGDLVTKALKMESIGADPYKDLNMDDLVSFIESIAKPAGELAGIPTPYLIQVEKALRSGDPRQFVFSKWALEEPKESLPKQSKAEILKLGLQKEEPNATPDKLPETYNMKDLNSYYNKLFAKTLPKDITVKKDYDPLAEAWGQMTVSNDTLNTLPNKKLHEIVDDIETDQSLTWTFGQYYQQWQARQKITNLADLVEYDKENPRAYLGNITPDQYKLLTRYEVSNKKERIKLIEDNPGLDINPRSDWLRNHPKENAQLAIWGQADILTQKAYDEAQRMIKELDIPDSALSECIPPKDVSEPYFKYGQAVEDYSAGSAEALLIRARNPQLTNWMQKKNPDLKTEIDTPIKSLEINVKNRALNDQYSGFSDEDSTWYLPSIPDKDSSNYKDGREYAREQFLLTPEGKSWYDDQNRIEAYNKGTPAMPTPETQVNEWVEAGNIKKDAQWHLYMSEHPETYKWALENKLTKDDGGITDEELTKGRNSTVWNLDVIKIRAKDDFIKLDKQVNDFSNLPSIPEKNSPDYKNGREYAKEEFLKTDDGKKWQDDIRRVDAFSNGADKNISEKYVEYGKIVDQYSASSAEAKLFRVDNPDLDDWGTNKELRDKEAWEPITKIPVLRINAKYRIQDAEYDAIVEPDETEQARLRDEYLANNPDYRMDRRRRDSYALTNPKTGEEFPENLIEAYVNYYELPDKGKRRDRFLLDNPSFAMEMHDKSGIDLPLKVPSVQYDDLYDQYKDDFDKMDGLAYFKSPYYVEDPKKRKVIAESMRLDSQGNITEFGRAEILRKAYGDYIPDEYAERYTDYRVVLLEGIPNNWPEDRNGNTLTWYEDDWFLQSNPNFYETIYLGMLGLDKVDFSKVPSPKVFEKYAYYTSLPKGKRREDYRRNNLDLEEWLIKTKKVTTSIQEKKRRSELTPGEKLEEDLEKVHD
ncbi:MAG: hypothetical protein A2158_05695 [Chloroflexi bacterium RBG_13_46_14]|nr:MAG: hypothetical protein A2158_05695 [Chloroflexi bacterium RBG_13_46_14]